MIFITTSSGLYAYDTEIDRHELVLGNIGVRRGIFSRKKDSGCFGICAHKATGRLILASRERLSGALWRKYASDVRLYLVDPHNGGHEVIAEIHDVNDVHQIAALDDLVFLTDTGKNRVVVYSLTQQKVVRTLLVGDARRDVNHINAISLDGEEIVLVLNNRKNETSRESQVLRLPLEEILSGGGPDVVANPFGKVTPLAGKFDVHDLQPFRGTFLLSASRSAFVFRLDNGEKLIDTRTVARDKWVRGIACDDGGIWVGLSEIGSRAYRHTRGLDGYLARFSPSGESLSGLRQIRGCGQINDLVQVTPDLA